MRHIFTILLCCAASMAFGQIQLNGTANFISPNCIQLNPDVQSVSGSAYITERVNIKAPFEFSCEVFVGFNDGGADGLALVLQNVGPTALGVGAGGMGYQGISPSVAIEFDTFINPWDSATFPNDHIAIMANGVQDHRIAVNNLAGPVNLLATSGNAEDGQFHDVNITWNPFTDSMRVYVDCSLRLEMEYDIVNNIFGGDSLVYVGVSAATGGARNEHRFCVKDIFYNLDTLYSCAGDTLDLDAGPGTAFTWATNYNISSLTTKETRVWPDQDTAYLVIATDSCGFPSRRIFIVRTTDPATIQPTIDDSTLCIGDVATFLAFNPLVESYQWQDGSTDSALTVTTGGTYWVERTNICGTVRDSFDVVDQDVPTFDLGPDDTLCQGTTVLLDIPVPNANFIWLDNPLFTDSTFLVANPGEYTVVVSNACGVTRDTIEFFEVLPPTFELGNDTTICDGNPYTLSALGGPDATFEWQDGSTNPTFEVTASGVYFVTGTNVCGTFSDTITIDFNLVPDINLGNDTLFCVGSTLTLDATWTPGSSYIWQNGDSMSTFTVSETGTYEVIVVNACGFDRDSIRIEIIEAPVGGFLPDTSLICDNMPDTLRTGYSRDIYTHTWQDLSTDSILPINSAGFYFVTVSNACGTASDSTIGRESISPEVDLGDSFEICEGQIISLDALWPGATYAWSTGATTSSIDVSDAAVYRVNVTNECGTVTDSTEVIALTPPEPFDLGEDQELCEGDSVLLDVSQPNVNPSVFYRWQDGTTNPTYLVKESQPISVVISNECGIETDLVNFVFQPLPDAFIQGDSILCQDVVGGNTLNVVSTIEGVDYLWNNGSGETSILAADPGTYYVLATNGCGVASDTLELVERFCTCEVYVPTAFSPNDDGFNDDFRMFPQCNIQSGGWKIFDRWGQMVFETEDPTALWDGVHRRGGLCPEGVYVWTYEYTYIGEGELQIKTATGTVTLLK
ncbi:MAG: gliding motility-associated C-terminal domain-containing protein [Bacteroidota bacterium]